MVNAAEQKDAELKPQALARPNMAGAGLLHCLSCSHIAFVNFILSAQRVVAQIAAARRNQPTGMKLGGLVGHRETCSDAHDCGNSVSSDVLRAVRVSNTGRCTQTVLMTALNTTSTSPETALVSCQSGVPEFCFCFVGADQRSLVWRQDEHVVVLHKMS